MFLIDKKCINSTKVSLEVSVKFKHSKNLGNTGSEMIEIHKERMDMMQ